MGDEEHTANYAIVGRPIWDVKALQELVSPGEILLTWIGFYYTQESRYIYEMIREHRYYKILGFKESLSMIIQQYEASMSFQEMQKDLNKNLDSNTVSIAIDSSFDVLTFNLPMEQIELFSRKIHPNECSFKFI